MKIKFCGAAQTVTGSQHLLEINGKKILLDCGMFQGKREDSFKMNKQFLFDPKELHSVVLSHAHIDHSGNLPTLTSKGFNGYISATPATRDLCSIMLQDSAYIQQKDVKFVNKRRAKKGEEIFNPLYTIEDVKNTMSKFKAFPYKLKFFIDGLDNSVAVTFYDAGHILGSAQVYLEITENGKKFTLGFSGDVGRKNLPILNDPDVMPQVDYLITESTYGGKLHDQAVEMENQLETVIKEAISINSKIIVPAFSVGRTQELVYMLSKLFNEKRLPEFPIYIDSPLSVNATEIFKIHIECYDSETSKLLAQDVDIFGTQNVHYIKDVDESKKLNNLKGPAMIISASGMCEAGRVLHHLANSIGDPNTLILIIGFMAENTLGRHLIELKDSPGSFVKIYGEMHQLNARVKVLNSFSAHADANELLDYYNCFDKKLLKRIFLVHGENEQQLIFKATLEKNGYTNIEIPVRGQEIIL